eukprot:Skav216657  [mRNA]  locus=scaffold1255:505180:505428:- [translate_table: standard]
MFVVADPTTLAWKLPEQLPEQLPLAPRYYPYKTGMWTEPAGNPIWCFLMLLARIGPVSAMAAPVLCCNSLHAVEDEAELMYS